MKKLFFVKTVSGLKFVIEVVGGKASVVKRAWKNIWFQDELEKLGWPHSIACSGNPGGVFIERQEWWRYDTNSEIVASVEGVKKFLTEVLHFRYIKVEEINPEWIPFDKL